MASPRAAGGLRRVALQPAPHGDLVFGLAVWKPSGEELRVQEFRGLGLAAAVSRFDSRIQGVVAGGIFLDSSFRMSGAQSATSYFLVSGI